MNLIIETKPNPSDIAAKARQSTMQTERGGVIGFTPPIDETYWLWRVAVSGKQAVIAFPKFFTIGIGFQVEEQNWNTNLPWTCKAEEIAAHIWDNANVSCDDEKPTFARVVAAISLLQDTIRKAKNESGIG